jgi:wobble nucleotide-excising tRNase
MIKKFNTIKSLAVFHDFSWDTSVRSINGTVDIFKQINILYGRNYSGKTTLSRIIRAMETSNISPNYTSSQFSVLWNNNSETTLASLQGHGKTIRVFNEDFVRENLSFLMDTSNQQGEVKPFTVIGADNIKIETEIKTIEGKLGQSEAGKETGLFAQLKTKRMEQTAAIADHKTASDELNRKKTEKATGRQNGIKYRSQIFGDQNYTITKLDQDIQNVLDDNYTPIDDTKRQELESGLTETPKANVSVLPTVSLLFQSLCDKTKEIVERKIGSSEKIQELVRNYTLNEWVKKGCELHKDKREVCAFCGGTISNERWTILEKHFDEETNKLEQDIKQIINEVDTHKHEVSNGFNISKDAFYTKFQSEIETLIGKYQDASTKYIESLNKLAQQLEKRKQAIASDFNFTIPEDVSNSINEMHAKYENICTRSNEHTNSLQESKQNAQNMLRLHEVRTFVDTVGYVAEVLKIDELKNKVNETETVIQTVQQQITEKQTAIENLKRKQNDEEKGALTVNEYLNHFFGHQFLTLKAITNENTETKQIRFEIMRGNERAFNLSEGECSLIAFCYFMAKLNDAETNDKKPIIWIDDPISSLDGNHIFFVYSLLRAQIVNKNKFEQLFISTHNLEFLKYLKRLNGKDEQNKDYQKAWFIIERENNNAAIKMMPKYLKKYITEFNYLFHQIYKCANAITTNDDNYICFYNFGNNARKFLEIYLYYKYSDAQEESMDKFFGGAIPAFLAERVNNEQSHLLGAFERGALPIDIPEIQLVAKQICQKIEEHDKEQYDSLLNSIGEQPAYSSSTLTSETQP